MSTQTTTGTARVKRGMAEMLKGGVIMDVVTPEQAKIAEDAGAVAVMALERVPADIRAQGGVSRMSDPDMIDGIIEAVSIPVMAKARIGHFVEAQILGELGVDFIDESEVLSPADYVNHINKWDFDVPFVCGATNLGEALRRSGLPREDVRIATKIPGRFHAEDLALTSLRDSAQRLGVEPAPGRGGAAGAAARRLRHAAGLRARRLRAGGARARPVARSAAARRAHRLLQRPPDRRTAAP